MTAPADAPTALTGPCVQPPSWGQGELLDELPLTGWRVESRAGGHHVRVAVRRLTSDVFRIDATGHEDGLRLVVPLASGEHVAGFGEQFGAVDLRGRTIDGWSEDLLQTHPRGTYFPAPLWHSDQGYAAVIDTFSRFVADVGQSDRDELRIDLPESTLTAWILLGPPKRTLGRIRELAGAATPTPHWAFGVWSSARSGTDAVLAECDRLAEEQLPVTAVWVDDPWIPQDNLGCGAPGTYPKGEYPDAAALVKGIHERGLKALGYLNCALYVDTPWDDEAARAGHHVLGPDGSPYRYHFFHPGRQQGGMLEFEDDVAGMVDFTSPAAVTWWREKIRGLLADGWDGWMQDFGEQIPEAATMADGSNGAVAHNRYPLAYHAATNAERVDGHEDTLFFVRSGHLGVQQHAPVMWGGDQSVDWGLDRGLPSVLMAGVSAGLSGMHVWAPDVLGIVELPLAGEDAGPDFLEQSELPGERGLDKELWLRWLEYAALTPILRLHLGFKPRARTPVDVWTDEETTSAFRRWSRLHLRLFPYLHSLGRASVDTGISVLRGLMVEFPEDPRCWEVEDEYLLGDAVLVAPVTERGATSRSVYLPEGEWEHLLTGEQFRGPADVLVDAPVGQIPVFQLAGTIVPMLPDDQVLPGDALVSPRWAVGDFPVEAHVSGSGDATTVLFDGAVLTVLAGELRVSGGVDRTYTVTRGALQ